MSRNDFGIICFDKRFDTSLFNNYRIALENYFQITNFKEIRSVNDLNDIEYIFIIDDHMTRKIWMVDRFINFINEKKIKVIVFNFERIFNSQFKNNVDFQKELEKFKFLNQFVSDVDDAEILSKKFITKQLLSKSSKIINFSKSKKNERILFLGQNKQRLINFKVVKKYYENRDKTIKDFKKFNPNFDILINKSLPYKKYLNKLAGYKYILNPLGTGNFINIRFYETLELGSIPIQQITEKMIYRYDELDFCLKFKSPKKLELNDFNFKTFNYYLEDYFNDIDLKKLIL